MSETIVIGPGDLVVTRDSEATIETYLGSCVGLALYNEHAVIGGMVHILLPDSTPERIKTAPTRYAIAGIPLLIQEMEAIGGDRRSFKAWMAGGAELLAGDKAHADLNIGQRNVHATSEILEANGIKVFSKDVGGYFGKRLKLHMSTGTAEFTSMSNQSTCTAEFVAPFSPETVGSIKGLSPLATIASRLFQIMQDETAAFEGLREEIYKDQALTATILRLCNSAYFGLPRKIAGLSRAMILLGMNRLRRIVLIAVMEAVSNAGGGFLPRQELFRHALACALSAEFLARKTAYPDPELAFIAGLLHDLGKITLAQYSPERFGRVMEIIRCGTKTFEEAEEETFGCNHARAGRILAESWQLPDVLVDVISSHHSPIEAATDVKLALLVHCADIISNLLGFGCGRMGFSNRIAPEALAAIPLSMEAVEDAIVFLPDMLKQVQDLV